MAKTPSRGSKGSNGDSGGDPPVEGEDEEPKIPAAKPTPRTRKNKRTRAQQTHNEEGAGDGDDSAGDEQKKKKPRFKSPDKVVPLGNNTNGRDNGMEAVDDGKEMAPVAAAPSSEDDEDMHEYNVAESEDNELDETERNNNEQKPAAKASDDAKSAANDDEIEPAVHPVAADAHVDLQERQVINSRPSRAGRSTPEEAVENLPPARQILKDTSQNVAMDANGIGNQAVQQDSEEEEEEVVEEEFEEEEDEEDEAHHQDWLTRPTTWAIIFFLLHCICWPIMFHPILPALVHTADYALVFYKIMLSSEKPVNQTYLDELANAALERHTKQRQMIADLLASKNALDSEVQPLLDQHTFLKEALDFVIRDLDHRKTPLIELEEKLSALGDLIAKSTDTLSAESLSEVRVALNDKDKKKLLDLSRMDLWEIPDVPETCGDEDTDEDSASIDAGEGEIAIAAIVQLDELQEVLHEIEEMANATAKDIMDDKEVLEKVQSYIREKFDKSTSWEDALDELIEKGSRSLASSASLARSTGSLAADEILRQIQYRIELEIADQTGRFDFATVRNGATVIRSGPRATSIPFSQTLPFLNRAMALAGLRFYGYDAEAALTPTDPPNALGQCWSFKSEKPSLSNQDSSRGLYATLTFRLARPVNVHSISIEHPPKEATETMDSAIRVFRVIGYEDAMARKAAYELGRFEYNVGNLPRQEFEVTRQGIPELRSITIAIESIWGQNHGYGCLYRVRVHGDDDEQDED